MIQRKQTLFLIVSVVLLLIATFEITTTFATAGTGITVATLSNFVLGDGKSSNALYSVMGIILLATAAMSAVTIFLFKKRKLQMHICLWSIFLLLLYYVIRMSCIISLAKYLKLQPHFDFYDAFPLLAIVFIILAYYGVRHDDRLIRESYRIR